MLVTALSLGLYLLNQSKTQPNLTDNQPAPTQTQVTLTPSPTGQPTITPTPTPVDQLVCVEALPDSIKIGQKLLFAGYADLIDSEQAPASQANLGGMIMMDQVSANQITQFRHAFKISPIIAVDQEGGTVQRYTAQGKLPGAAAVAADYSPNQAYQLYLKDAQYLKSQGMTTNFAPVTDVISRQPVPLPGRLYSSDPQTVVAYATTFIQATQAAGLTPVIKHFPGLGSATGNTDLGPATTDPFDALQDRDLIPYRKLVSLKPDVMISNAMVPQLTNQQPAIWSAAAVSLLRSYGYTDAVVYTDSLTAKAIPGYLSEAAIKSWQADIDIALVVQTRTQTSQLGSLISTIIDKASQALVNGQLDRHTINQSVLRILKRKQVDACTLNML